MIWIILLLILTNIATAQPEIAWTQEYGQAGADYCFGVYVLDDGSIVIGGDTYTDIDNNGNTDLYILKLNEDGEEIWHNLYGDENSQVCASFIQTSDGGFSLAGGSTNGRGIVEELRPNRDDYEGPVFIVKIDSTGEEQWSESYEGTVYSRDHVQTDDGGFALVGMEYWDNSYFLKTDSEGDLEWHHVFEGENDFYYNMYSLTYTGYDERNDRDSFIISGSKYDPDEYGLVIYGLEGQNMRNWLDLGGDANGGSVIKIFPTDDEGYLCFGEASVMKLNDWGTIQWMRIIENEHLRGLVDVVQSPDGNYVSVGTVGGAYHDILYLTKISPEGDQIWEQDYDVQIWSPHLDIAPDGSFVIAGSVNSDDNSFNIIVIKTEPDELSIRDKSLNHSANGFFINAAYPNPFNSTVVIPYHLQSASNVKVSVYNSFGKELHILQNGFQFSGKQNVSWTPEFIPSGTYIVKIEQSNTSALIPVSFIK